MFRELSEPVVAPGVMASLMELNIADSASMTGDARVQMAKDVKNVLRSMEAPNRYLSLFRGSSKNNVLQRFTSIKYSYY